MKKITKIVTITVLGLAPTVGFSAVKSLGNGLFVPQYTQAELANAGCSEPVWTSLVNQYVKSRGLQREVEFAGEEYSIMQTPKNEWEKCFAGALAKINDLKSKINKIFGLLSGDFDLFGAGIDLAEKYLEQQCSKINRYTASAVGQVTGAVNGGINDAQNAVIGGINDAVKDATGVSGAGSTIINNSTKNTDPLIGGGKITTGTVKDVITDYSGMFGSNGNNSSVLDSFLK